MITIPIKLAKVTRTDGKLRIGGVASDNRPDLFRTVMSGRLYEDFLRRQTEFDPYLSIAHYLTPIAKLDKLYVDGRYLKFISDVDLSTSIGRSLAKRLSDPEIRSQTGVSIGFTDEDYFFDDTAGGLLTYVGGLLVHTALTTIPANPRSRVTLVELSRAKSQREDASKLVGPVYATWLEKRERRLHEEGKHDLSLVS